MGRVIQFPAPRSAPFLSQSKPGPKPTLICSDDPPGPPAVELACGLQEGTFTAYYQVASHAEFQALVAARRSGPISFLREIQRCAFIRREPAAAAAPLAEFSDYLHGRNGGGVGGPYASGYRAAFALVEPFVERLH